MDIEDLKLPKMDHSKPYWWGYLHELGTFRVKSFHSFSELKEAKESPFVKMVFKPFIAYNREQALEKVKALYSQLILHDIVLKRVEEEFKNK